MIRNLKSNPGVKVTIVGAVVNILLAALKFFAGTLGKSAAMVADAFHSLSDLLTDIIVAFTHEIGRIPKDAEERIVCTVAATVFSITSNPRETISAVFCWMGRSSSSVLTRFQKVFPWALIYSISGPLPSQERGTIRTRVREY